MICPSLGQTSAPLHPLHYQDDKLNGQGESTVVQIQVNTSLLGLPAELYASEPNPGPGPPN